MAIFNSYGKLPEGIFREAPQFWMIREKMGGYRMGSV